MMPAAPIPHSGEKQMTTLAPVNQILYSLWPHVLGPQSQDENLLCQIRTLDNSQRELTDRGIREQTQRLRQQVADGRNLLDKNLLVPAFALVNEAVRRAIGIDYYDVQLLAGLALTRGAIAEMQTGEGKTFVAALPAFVHALTGRGAHVMTVNRYLAQRDYELMSPAFELLGMSAGLLAERALPDEKRAAYACDVTYGPGYEFGFDYLRDQVALWGKRKARLGETYRGLLKSQPVEQVAPLQRGFAFAIADEADSVLIDEATTPLLLAEGPAAAAANADVYQIAKRAAHELVSGRDYVVDPTADLVRLTARGARALSSDSAAAAKSGLQRPWAIYVEQALRAATLLKKDVDYVVDDGEVRLVDQSTGRVFKDRSWRDGLHQAVQAKEDVPITVENLPLARISRQRFLRLYDAMCGMTGTASGSERELWQVYRLPVVAIPPRKPCQRKILPTRFFAGQDSKWTAIADDVASRHASGQPILVGTRTIENSELLAQQFDARNIPYCLLNGKQTAEEAMIVARAGQIGAITIATNMAGRGTDIKLDPGVEKLGGLHVIGTERHESARVDRQLIGRAARQGDPGSFQFFVSAEDRLLRLYAPSLSHRMIRSPSENGELSGDFSREVSKAQQRAERIHAARRQQLFTHEQWFEDILSKLAQES
jgi:preprotein translocase subunit SecA